MPKRTDIKSIMILGAGPIVIGQACEFDYSGAQACKALREEGYRVILVNSNPATIMTDPDTADATYIEPLNVKVVERIIAREKPDAILPTMGGQTALNLAMELDEKGILKKYDVELIGASPEAIDKAEDRQRFKEAMTRIGLESARSGIAYNMSEALAVQQRVGFPAVIRPSFTLGGSGGGIAYNMQEFVEICERGLALSPTHELLIEESLLGWKEYEMEVVRDKADNCIIVCSIENFDPMGIHTGDSITVAPAQTLTDREYQIMRDASIAVLREIGVDTGGSNVQFAVNPKNGRLIVIEMNPRVSRSSALASKATGFPIAKVAAKLAVGYTLDELKNDITGGATPASFEPTIDYVVTKVPRFAFEKFPQADDRLTTQMKSVGEVMAIGSSFQESLQKALRGLETGKDGLTPLSTDREEIIHEISEAGPERIFYVADAMRLGLTNDEIHEMTSIDPWFLAQMRELIDIEKRVECVNLADISREDLFFLKQKGFSDKRLAKLTGCHEDDVRNRRHALNIRPVYKRVDTCAAEFETKTAYMYSPYQTEDESQPSDKKKIVVLGGGPNRIGQGIEFDYCCVHAALAMREDGYETIMVNCNPETVSTDYDTSDRLYFEPLTFEDVMNIVEKEKPEGVIVQFGGQTPLNLAVPLMRAGVPILGTSPDAIDRAEDRERFQALIEKLGLLQPPNGTAMDLDQALEVAERITYPVVVRPSYVLGGRAMAVVYDKEELVEYFREQVPEKPEHPILIDKFLEHAVEVDVDALSDGKEVYVAGIMEHIEEAGIHSGDSACVLPSFSLSYDHVALIAAQAEALARELKVVGLMNIQFAIKGDDLYILEVNPRASRTAPFVSKATGVPLPYMATQVMLGKTLDELDPWSMRRGGFTCVKEAVLPFQRFPGVDIILGPEMHSTGEVMGMGSDFPEAYYKSQLASGQDLPQGGNVFISVNDRDKPILPEVAAMFADLGFHLLATSGTARYLRERGLEVEEVLKVYEGRPNIVDRMINGDVALVINTASGKNTARDSKSIRHTAVSYGVPYCTTVAGAKASAIAIGKRREDTHVESLQEYYAREARG